MITINMNLPSNSGPKFSQGMNKTVEYYKTDPDALEEFADYISSSIEGANIENIEQLNETIKEAADKRLKSKYKRRVVGKYEKIKEPPWMTKEIIKEIKKRKQINREKRGAKTQKEKNVLHMKYQKQKKYVKGLVKEQLSKHEKKITNEIRLSTNKSKALWENIDKLKKKERKSKAEVHLHNANGEKLNSIEESQALVNYWKTIYQKHQNTTGKVWNEEIKDRYDRKMEQEEEMKSNRKLLNEHMDMAFAHNETVAPMNTPMINEENVMKCVKQMKNKTAPGPCGLKAEFYKALVKTENGLSTLTKCMQVALEEEGKVDTWKVSHTKMIPKKAKPTADELRPIALTNVSCKMFMTLIKDEIEDHLRRAVAIIETQAGFTKGGRIEDNLFILNYCVEASFKKKAPLFVASIDYSKAFDSIKRSRMIEALMMDRVHPLVIEVIANIYQGDSTIINLNNSTSEEIPVTSGIRQGCTGSTVLFKIITYIIIQIMQATSLGFRNEQFYIPMLFFADDGLILSKSEQEMKTMLKEISNVSKACGLDINKNKSAIIIYNLKDQITEIEGISVKESLKYLGLSIGNKRDLFSKQKKDMITKAQKMANMTYGIIGKSCKKLMIGKVYWKSLALPSILYGGNIISLTEQDINKLQVIENGVYR